jgi:ABC-type Mn2+/Zn2+ transport system ATPase subunit
LKGIKGTFNNKSLILGPNGSGKTTLFRAICGLTNIASGEILIDEKNIENIFSSTGVLSTNFQEVYTLLASNVYDLIRLYTDLSDGSPDQAFNVIQDLGMSSDLLKKHELKELSAGQQKIVCTALSLSMKSKHILLDEPFEQLDPARKGRMIKHLEDYEGVILVNTHETWLLRNLRKWVVFFMFEGLLYGPLPVEDLLNAEISLTDEPDALLKIPIANKTVSILKGGGGGTLLTSLENLDRMYELAGGS